MASRHICVRVLVAVVLLGLLLRAYHYLRDPAMWHDEAAVAVNVIEKDWRELLGPLYWAEAAPPLFLWLERGVVLTLGDGTFALRLVPFLASCLSVVLLAWVAWRLLPPWGAVAAAGLVAVSDRLLWHACEAKPYAIDVALAAGLIALHLAAKDWRLEWLLLVQVVLAPVVLWLSYPGAFLLGASLLVVLPQVVASRRWSAWGLYSLWTLAVFVAFVALVVGPARAQWCGPMDACWAHQFPPYDTPAMVPVWTVASSLEVGRDRFQPLGTVLAFVAIVGGVVWVRAGRGPVVVLCALPLLLALVASFLRQYPFGASRLEAFAAPGLALLVGAGLGPASAWLASRARWAPAVVAVALLASVGQTAYRVVVPWPRPDGASAAELVLARVGPDDVVCGNKWEHLYYFRSLGRRFVLMEARDERPQPRGCSIGVPPAGACWLVFADEAASTRAAVRDAGWVRERRRESQGFEGTDVYWLEGAATGVATPGLGGGGVTAARPEG